MPKYTIQFQVECDREKLFIVPPADLPKSARIRFAIENMLKSPIEQALMKLVQEMGINNIANIGVVLGEAHLTKPAPDASPEVEPKPKSNKGSRR